MDELDKSKKYHFIMQDGVQMLEEIVDHSPNFAAYNNGDLLVASGVIVDPSDNIEIKWMDKTFRIPTPYNDAQILYNLGDLYFLQYFPLFNGSGKLIQISYSIYKYKKDEKPLELTQEEIDRYRQIKLPAYNPPKWWEVWK